MPWEVATACDVKLSALFGSQGPHYGQTIDIDPVAIETSLEQLSPPDGSGRALLTAVHDNSLSSDSDGTTRPDGSCSNVLIAIGGGVGALMEDEAARAEVKKVIHGTCGVLERTSFRGKVKASRFRERFAEERSLLRTPDSLQATTIHELQHVVDRQQPRLDKKSRTQKARNEKVLGFLEDNQRRIDAVAALAATVELYHLDEPLHTGVAILGGFATFVALFKANKPTISWLEHCAYRSTTLERRARRTEKRAEDFPLIINIQNTNKHECQAAAVK